MAEDRVYVAFGIIGMILAIAGALIATFSNENSMAWVLVGSGIAIIWVGFHRIYHAKKK